MNSTMYFTICSLFYSVLMMFICFSFKKNVNVNIRQKIYNLMVISNFCGIIIELICVFTCMHYNSIPIINAFFLKMFLVYLLTWISLLTLYIFIISISSDKIKKLTIKILKIIFVSIYLISIIFIFVLPMSYNIKNGIITYTYGVSVNFLYMIVEIMIVACLIFMFSNLKNYNSKKYSPLFAFIVGGSLIMIIQASHPQYLLMTSMETFVTFLMYFTIDHDSNDVTKNIDSKNKEEK